MAQRRSGEPARRKRRASTWAAPAAVGTVVGVGTAALSVAFLAFALPAGIVAGLLVGGGAALLTTPLAPAPLALGAAGATPTSVPDALEQIDGSLTQLDAAMRRLQSRPLWSGSQLDEKIHQLIHGISTLEQLPALRGRHTIDGDVQMLHVLATDYLPTIVNLAIENDRMHHSFSGSNARAQVEKNVAELEQQVDILHEALDRIETDIVRGTTQSVHEHAAFLQLRFEQSGASSQILDLNQSFSE